MRKLILLSLNFVGLSFQSSRKPLGRRSHFSMKSLIAKSFFSHQDVTLFAMIYSIVYMQTKLKGEMDLQHSVYWFQILLVFSSWTLPVSHFSQTCELYSAGEIRIPTNIIVLSNTNFVKFQEVFYKTCKTFSWNKKIFLYFLCCLLIPFGLLVFEAVAAWIRKREGPFLQVVLIMYLYKNVKKGAIRHGTIIGLKLWRASILVGHFNSTSL